MATRKRVRPRADAKAHPSEMDKLLDQIEDIHNQQEVLATVRKELEGKLFASMQGAKLNELIHDSATAEITQSAGRKVTTINPELYYQALQDNGYDDQDFYSSVSVSVTKAKENLSGKEIEKISDVTPAKPGPKKLKFKFVPEGKKK